MDRVSMDWSMDMAGFLDGAKNPPLHHVLVADPQRKRG